MSPREGRCKGRHRLVAVVSARARVCRVALVTAVLPATALLVAVPVSAGTLRTGVAAPARSAQPSPPQMSNCPKGMVRKEGTGFIIWACNDGTANAALNQAYAAVNSVWPAMTNLMGNPLPDVGGIAGGGPGIPPTSPKAKWIDLYLLYPTQVLTREGQPQQLNGNIAEEVDDNVKAHPPSGYQTGSGYMLLGRDRLAAAGFKSDFVHEFFHVLQNRWNVGRCGAKVNWFVEASAVWAETQFARVTAGTEVYDPWFTTGFEENPGASLLSSNGNNPYDAFIWPFFMEQHGGGPGIIAKTWQALAGKATCAQMNQAISSVLPFQKYFGDFALENYDAKLPNIGNKTLLQWPTGFQSMYQQLDNKFPEVLPKESPLKNPAINTATPQQVSVADLATQYDQWQTGLDNWMLSIEFNFSGITNRQNLDITAIAAEKNKYTPTSRPFLVIPVPTNANYLRICAPVDSPSGDITQGIIVHLALANHSIASGGKAGGSYTVTPRATCAASASGNYTETYSQTNSAGGKYNETVTLKNANFFPTSSQYEPGWTLDLTKGTYTYNGTYGSGSGPLSDIRQNPPPAVIPTLFAWDIGSYRNQPSFGISATDFRTSSGKILRVEGGFCPLSASWSYGKYVNNLQAVDFTCTDSNTVNGTTTKISASGTIQAVDPIPCGIWSGPSCPVTAAARGTISAPASGLVHTPGSVRTVNLSRF